MAPPFLGQGKPAYCSKAWEVMIYYAEAHPPGEGNDEGAGPEANYFGPGDDETESMSIIRVAAPYLSSLSWTCQKRSVRCAVSSDNLP